MIATAASGPGTIETRIEVRTPSAATNPSARSGPPTAPKLSMNRSNPYARPYAWGDTTSASSAPFGGDNNDGGCHTTLSTSEGVTAIGIAVGVGATIASGGSLLGASAFGLSGASLSGVGVAAGFGAAGLDGPGCSRGERVACLGLFLGGTGALAGIPEIIGALADVEEESAAAGALTGQWPLGLHLGLAGTMADSASLLSLCR
jgi:hypothetical protein